MAVPRKQCVEEHYDDCGTCLAGLGADVVVLAADYMIEVVSESSDEENNMLSQPFMDNLATCLFQNTGIDQCTAANEDRYPVSSATAMTVHADTTETVQHASHVQRASDIFSLTQALYDMPPGIDMIELCGGKGRTSRVCVRRGLSTGGNFDIVTGVDLNDPKQQSRLDEYIDRARPLVAVLQPTCTAFGPQGRQNMSINYDGWERSFLRDSPHCAYCGEVALKQISDDRFYIREQPYPTTMDDLDPWPLDIGHTSHAR